ncbi:unnamed protein product [Symbiodinium natans]|uniref:Uncharacterized protein n=1 Tax=Symbiodinium natans TaxID=878477 RepID=A0A812NSU6_9DINO|nr:unnamed protein product [Symbiodinium natans]
MDDNDMKYFDPEARLCKFACGKKHGCKMLQAEMHYKTWHGKSTCGISVVTSTM